MRIKRSHDLGREEVRQRVDRLAGDLKSQFGVESEWAGDQLKVSGSGIDGHLAVADDNVELDVRLGFALKLMESNIRAAVERAMDKHLV